VKLVSPNVAPRWAEHGAYPPRPKRLHGLANRYISTYLKTTLHVTRCSEILLRQYILFLQVDETGLKRRLLLSTAPIGTFLPSAHNYVGCGGTTGFWFPSRMQILRSVVSVTSDRKTKEDTVADQLLRHNLSDGGTSVRG
jgi:hypothetical protein